MLSNKGTINGFEVLDLKYENNVLYYKVDGTLTNTTRMEAEGLTVVQSVLHMLDGYYAKAVNYIPSVSVNPDNQWHEVNIKDIDENHITEVENYMKQVIQNGVRLSIKYINGKDYPNTRYQNFDLLRIVSFDDLDSQSRGTLYINYTKKGFCDS